MDEFGTTNIDDLSEGQLTEYIARCVVPSVPLWAELDIHWLFVGFSQTEYVLKKVGSRWVKVPLDLNDIYNGYEDEGVEEQEDDEEPENHELEK